MTRLLLLVLAFAATAVAAAPAAAATRYEIVDDCADDSRLQGRYTVAELRDARRNLRTEVAEYTDCEDVLRRAELALLERASGDDEDARGAAPATTAGGEPPAPLAPADEAERTALRDARESGGTPVAVRGREIEPGSAGFTAGAVRNEMPGSLLAAVIGLALLCAGVLVGSLRRLRAGFAFAEGTGRP